MGKTGFGAMLKQRRKAHDLTQAELADRVGCSASTIHMVESGERRASRQLAALLADHLKVAPDAREEFLQAARTWSPPGHGQVGCATTEQVPPDEAPLAPDLPVYLTPLVGREREIETIEARLLNNGTHGGAHGGTRLLTLTGPAGVGKTRLASTLASGLQSRFSDGVCFVALAPVRDPALVISTIAGALGVKEQSAQNGKTLPDALKKRLLGKELLLILDNMEQVIEAGPLIAAMLGSCPTVKALVTSREALHVRGESVFPVAPLSLPDLDNFPPLEAVPSYPAVALFVECAQRSAPSFALTAGNAREIATICAHMDGLPLAIELAAARVRFFSPGMLLAKLEEARGHEAFRLLGDGARDLPERHRTLQAAIGWSYDLLSKEEQTLFMRLGVFVGGCTLPAIEAVCNAEGDLGVDALYGMSSLLDKSLLKREQEEGADAEPRFHLLETVREYAVSQLEAQGREEVTRLRRWHADYFLALAEAAEVKASSEEQQVWFRRLARDHNNSYAALGWLLEQEEAELAARMAGAMGDFWHRHTHPEAMRWLLQVLAQKQHISPAVLSKVLRAACLLEMGLGNLAQARTLAEENLVITRSLGDTQSTIRALLQLGAVIGEAGDIVQAELSYRESLRLAREVGNVLTEAVATSYLAEIARAGGDYQEARSLYESNLRLAQEVGSNWDIAVILHNLGKVALGMGDPAEAEAQLRRSLLLFQEIGSKGGTAYCLSGLGETAVQMGALERGVTLFSVSDALLNSVGIVLERVERAGRDAALEQAHTSLEPAAFKAAWEVGQNISLEETVDYALEYGCA